VDSTSAANLAAAGLTAIAAAFAGLAAARSSQASRTLSRIEQHRRHEELTPQFSVTLQSGSGKAAASPTLRVTLIGPLGLGGGLDRCTVRVRDDRLRAPSGLADGPTAADIAGQVWGPFRFTPGSEGADAVGRCVGPVPVALDELRLFQMERSTTPAWYADPGAWEKQYPPLAPVRLAFHCEAAGQPPWDVLVEVRTGKATSASTSAATA